MVIAPLKAQQPSVSARFDAGAHRSDDEKTSRLFVSRDVVVFELWLHHEVYQRDGGLPQRLPPAAVGRGVLQGGGKG